MISQNYEIDTFSEFVMLSSTLKDALSSIPLPTGFGVIISITKELAVKIAEEVNKSEGTNYKDIGSLDFCGLMVYFHFRDVIEDGK